MKFPTVCAYYCIVICMAFSSCRTVYAPNAVHTPLLQEKGEIKAAVSISNTQIAAAVSEHIGIMANGYLNRYTSDNKDFKNTGRGTELGIGYFNHTDQRLTYEAYAGAGLYRVIMKEAEDAKKFDTHAMKYFVQPSIGWVHRYVEVALTPRLSMVKYMQPKIMGYTPQEIADYHFDVVDQKLHAFFEPALTLRGGYRFVKIQLQYGRSFKLSKNKINRDEDIGSIGLIFDIADWYKK